MKLEIDIDEDYYKIICKRVEENKPYHSPYEYEVIADGKPIEQEPTTKNNLGVDCISRKAVLELLEDTNNGWIINEVLQLPSVTPQEPKTGHWIKTGDYYTGAYGSIEYVECSCCHEDSLEEGDFCPNCGADMREVEE